MDNESSMPVGASHARVITGNARQRVSVAMRQIWLPLLATMPWLLMTIAGLLWALTLQRGVPHSQALLIAQPIVVAVALVLAALVVGAVNILVGTLSLLWKPTPAGALALVSGAVVVVGAGGLWHVPA